MNVVFRDYSFISTPGFIVEGSGVFVFGGGKNKRFCLKKKVDTNKGARGYKELWHPTAEETIRYAKYLANMSEEALNMWFNSLKEKYDIKGTLILQKEDWYSDWGGRTSFERIKLKLKSFLKIRGIE